MVKLTRCDKCEEELPSCHELGDYDLCNTCLKAFKKWLKME